MLSPAAAETAPTVPAAGATIEVAFRAISSWATVALAAASRCLAWSSVTLTPPACA